MNRSYLNIHFTYFNKSTLRSLNKNRDDFIIKYPISDPILSIDLLDISNVVISINIRKIICQTCTCIVDCRLRKLI